jgi:2-oxoisovalerate dehydrogenase E1 component
MGAALGLALAGFKPVPEIMFMDFVGVCLDQLANHAAKIRYMSGGRQSAPLTVRVAVGASSGPQHSQSLEAWLMHVPGLKVVWPSTPTDAIGLLNSCLDDDDPVVFIEAMSLFYGGGRDRVPEGDFWIPIGKAKTARTGSDVTVVSYGPTVKTALASAEELSGEGISVEIVDLRSLLPLDLDAVLESVGRTKRLVVVHQSTGFCGPGAEIAAAVGQELFGELRAPIQRVAASFTPVPRSPELEAAALPGQGRVSDAIRSAFK